MNQRVEANEGGKDIVFIMVTLVLILRALVNPYIQRTVPQNKNEAYLITFVVSSLLKNPPTLNVLYTKSERTIDTSS